MATTSGTNDGDDSKYARIPPFKAIKSHMVWKTWLNELKATKRAFGLDEVKLANRIYLNLPESAKLFTSDMDPDVDLADTGCLDKLLARLERSPSSMTSGLARTFPKKTPIANTSVQEAVARLTPRPCSVDAPEGIG